MLIKIKIEHIAIASNSVENSDKFYENLLKLQKIRTFEVSEDLMSQFFGVRKIQNVIRYSNEYLNVEVFITDDNQKSNDIFTHTCIIVENRDELVERAKIFGYEVKKVPRKDSDNYYLFIKDDFGNLFEIKSP